MKIDEFELLADLVQSESITTTAHRLFLSVSTVSYRLASIEKELKIRLFDHSRNRITLTEAGKYYFEHTDDLTKQYLQVVRKAQLIDEQKEFKLGLPGAYIYRYKNKIVHRFENEFPGVHFVLKSVDFRDGMDPLLSGSVDYLMTFRCRTKHAQKSLLIHDLLEQPWYCLMSNSHALAKKDVVEPRDVAESKLLSLNILRNSMEEFFDDNGLSEDKSTIIYYDDLPVMLADIRRQQGVMLTSYNPDSILIPGCCYKPVNSKKGIHFVGVAHEGKFSKVTQWMSKALIEIFTAK